MPISPPCQAQLPPSATTPGATPTRGRCCAPARPLLLIGLLACGCSGESLLLPSEGVPAAIDVVHGDGQSGRVGEPLTDPLVVEVTDSRGRPVEGASVTFELTPAAPGADVTPHTATTDANGLASARIVLGTTIGRQTGQAIVVMGRSAAPAASFTATVLSENANSIAAVGGQDQTGHVGAVLSSPLVVQVSDTFGNPIPGVPVNWTAVGGGSVSEASTTTDDQGRASVERTLGPGVGQQSTVATSEGLAGSPVTFLHAALAGDASILAIISGDGQTGQVGTQLPADLVVRLIDAQGNGVPGTAVTWVVATGGGTVTPQNSITDSDGRASARWTLGRTPGSSRLDAVVSGVGVASFTAIATAGSPAVLFIRTQPPSSATNGIPLSRQPVIQLRDAGGNDVGTAGVQVAVGIGLGSGELIGTRQRITDSNGRATFTDLAISGSTGSHTLVFSSSGFASATSSVIDVASIGTTTTITSDAPDPSTAGTGFTVAFRVTSDGPTPPGTVTVAVDGDGDCTGALSGGQGSCQLVLANAGQKTLRATYSGAPGFNSSSGTEGHQVQAPPPANRPPHADFHANCNGLTCQFTDASSDPDGQVTARSWNFGDGSSGTDQNPSHSYALPGTYTVTLTVTDNGGATDAKSDKVKVEVPPNKPPSAEFEVSCTNLTCTFTDKSKDDDGSIVSWHWDFGDGQSSTDQNPSHPYAAPKIYHVTLTVTDNGGASDSKTHDAHPQAPPPPPNQPPQAQGDAYTTNEDAPLTVGPPGVLGNDTDPEGSALSAVNPGTPSHGSLTLNSNGSFVYTPAASFSGTDSFTYQASDGSLLSGQATVTITVNPVNHAPVAQPDAYTTPGGDLPLVVSAPGVLGNDSDPDAGTTLTAVNPSSPSKGTLALNTDGSFTYTPNSGASGDDSFTYEASDGTLTSTATVTITIQ